MGRHLKSNSVEEVSERKLRQMFNQLYAQRLEDSQQGRVTDQNLTLTVEVRREMKIPIPPSEPAATKSVVFWLLEGGRDIGLVHAYSRLQVGDFKLAKPAQCKAGETYEITVFSDGSATIKRIGWWTKLMRHLAAFRP